MQKKYLVLQLTSIRKENWSKPINEINHFFEWLTDYFFYEDIYCYSEKEFFIDITNYLELYKKTLYQLAFDMKKDIIKKWNIRPTIGIGTNLFLAKTACDIITKEKNVEIAYLDEKEYISTCSTHTPLTDFWQISHSMMLKLKKMGITTMRDIRMYPYEKIYEVFGYNAEYLINHSLGLESSTINELNKKVIPKTVSSTITFQCIKSRMETCSKLQELLDFNILRLKEKGLFTKTVYLYIKYANNIIPREIICIKLSAPTNSYQILMEKALEAYNIKTNLFFPIEKLAVSFTELSKTTDFIYQIKQKKKKLFLLMPNIFQKRKIVPFPDLNPATFLLL